MLTQSSPESKMLFPNFQTFLDTVEAYVNDVRPQTDLQIVTEKTLRSAIQILRTYGFPACPHCAVAEFLSTWLAVNREQFLAAYDARGGNALDLEEHERTAVAISGALLKVVSEYIGWNITDTGKRATLWFQLLAEAGEEVEAAARQRAQAHLAEMGIPANEAAPPAGSRH